MAKPRIDRKAVAAALAESRNVEEASRRLGLKPNAVWPIKRELEGCCIRCGSPDIDGYHQCATCREYVRRYNRRRRRSASPDIIRITLPADISRQLFDLAAKEDSRSKSIEQVAVAALRQWLELQAKGSNQPITNQQPGGRSRT